MTDRSEEYRAIVDQYSQRRKLKRPPFIVGDLVYIPLQDGKLAYTEAEYYELVNGCSWRYNITSKSRPLFGYVLGPPNWKTPSASQHRTLHRWLWYHVNGEIPKGMCMDHINRNRLDNRLANLRIVTYSDSARNVIKNFPKGSGPASKYPGVTFDPKCTEKRWRAVLNKDRTRYSLGYYKTEEEAFAAYYAKAVELGVEHSIPKIFQI